MVLAFAFSVAVQYNDPDPVQWMLIYGSAAVASGLFAAGRGRWQLAAAVGVVALVWAATILPRVLATPPEVSLFAQFEMHDIHVEEEREMLGLGIVAGWMAVIAISDLIARRRLRAASR